MTPSRPAARWGQPWLKGQQSPHSRESHREYGKADWAGTMLKEYLSSLNRDAPLICWRDSMPGVQICRFTPQETGHGALSPIPVCGQALHFEALFCLSGRLTLQLFQGPLCAMEAPGVFLLSDSSGLRSCQCSTDLGGILVTVDAAAARDSLQAICSALWIELDTGGVRKIMSSRNGCAILMNTPWTKSFFDAFHELSETSQERYCVFKSVELLYLLCEKNTADAGAGPIPSTGMFKIKAYIQAHLSEKITIDLLCKRFLVSPTYLKENFRRTYGVPVHTFLVQQRIRRARELLCTTDRSVQHIARSVGYQGMSQFNTAFKQYYGMTPGQCRKMSETATLRLL